MVVPLVCGMYFSHFRRAAAYAGAFTETPLTEIVCPLASIRIPLLLKSGKFGTPLARMHLENASVELVELEPLPVDGPDPVGALDPAGEFEQQAAIVAAAASAPAAVSNRAGRNACVRRSRIKSPFSCAHRFYAADGFGTVSHAWRRSERAVRSGGITETVLKPRGATVLGKEHRCGY